MDLMDNISECFGIENDVPKMKLLFKLIYCINIERVEEDGLTILNYLNSTNKKSETMEQSWTYLSDKIMGKMASRKGEAQQLTEPMIFKTISENTHDIETLMKMFKILQDSEITFKDIGCLKKILLNYYRSEFAKSNSYQSELLETLFPSYLGSMLQRLLIADIDDLYAEMLMDVLEEVFEKRELAMIDPPSDLKKVMSP